MNRLESTNTTSELKDNFKKERKEMLQSLSKNYQNQMNNSPENIPQHFENKNQQYIFNDISFNSLNSQKKPIPYTEINNDINRIKSLSESNNYTNFIPLPENTRDQTIEINKNNVIKIDNSKQNLFINKMNNDSHPKKMYTNDPNDKNELLNNSIKPIKYEPINFNNIGKFNNSYNQQNPNIYIAEIGDKRRLSNIIFDSLKKTYNTYQNLNEYEILHIINSLNINNNKWSKDNTKDFVKELKKKINESQNIKINNSNIEENNSYNIIQENELFERNTKEIDYYITIDSNDRDKDKWDNPNLYQIIFGPTNDPEKKNGYINQSFNNVQCVELIEAIIPRKTNSGTDYETLPYILLEISELGNVYQGTNDYLRKTFSQLTFDKVIGNYRYCTFSDNTKIKKIFNPRIALNKMTLKFLKPNGEIYDFGNYLEIENDPGNKEILSNNILTFKITCIQRSLDTMYLNKN